MEPGTKDGAKRPEFEALIEQSIEEGLRHVLGQSGLQMVLSLYPVNDLSIDPVRFHEVLKSIFMEGGAAVLEQEIARRLLDKVAKQRDGWRRSRRSWLVTARSNANPSKQVSEREKRVLRQFVALASLPNDNPMVVELDASGGASSIELTSLRFASAFKKGT